MIIDKETIYVNLVDILDRLLILPEIGSVMIRGQKICSIENEEGIRKAVNVSYYDKYSDIDIRIDITLHPNDIACAGICYVHRVGLSRKEYLGLTVSKTETSETETSLLYRLIMKNGMRYDICFQITSDLCAPVYHFIESDQYKSAWHLSSADNFWFVQIQALGKLYRGDYLVADHLAHMQINETLVAQMVKRDIEFETDFHRYGYKETLAYTEVIEPLCPYHCDDMTFNMIADKLYIAANTYDRLVVTLNPEYEPRAAYLMDIWSEYHHS